MHGKNFGGSRTNKGDTLLVHPQAHARENGTIKKEGRERGKASEVGLVSRPTCHKLHHGGVACNLVVAALAAGNAGRVVARVTPSSRILGRFHPNGHHYLASQIRQPAEIKRPPVEHPLKTGCSGGLDRRDRHAVDRDGCKVRYTTQVEPHPGFLGCGWHHCISISPRLCRVICHEKTTVSE